LKIVGLNLLMVSALVFGSDRAFDQSSEIDFSKLQMTFAKTLTIRLAFRRGVPTRGGLLTRHGPAILVMRRLPTPDLGVFPFTLEGGILRIEARKNDKGKWESGLLASADGNGRGFSQQYGYFEMRAKLPKGPGSGRLSGSAASLTRLRRPPSKSTCWSSTVIHRLPIRTTSSSIIQIPPMRRRVTWIKIASS